MTMAKDFKRGDDYRLYLNTGSWASPTYVWLKSAVDLAVDEAPTDIAVEETGMSTGHLQGYGDPSITCTLNENRGDTNVATLLTAMRAGTMKEIALCNGPIATAGTNIYRLEAIATGFPLSASKGSVASWGVDFKRHANSDNDLTHSVAS